MTDFYDDLSPIWIRSGLNASKPVSPPDIQAMYWATDTQKLWAVNNLMQWYVINPTPGGQYHIRVGAFVTNIFAPNVLFVIPTTGALISRITIRVDSAYDPGVTATVGDDAVPDRFFAAVDIDLQTPGDYTVPSPYYQYAFGDAIKIYGSATSATGSGNAFIEYDEAPT